MASLENKSFYYAYFYTEAGGNFIENDFVTANLELLQKFVLKTLDLTPYMLLEYGVYLNITKVENGKVIDEAIHPFMQVTLHLERIETAFAYKPKTGLFSAKLTKNDKDLLQELIQTHEDNPDLPSPIRVTVDWESSKLVPLEGDLAQDGDLLEAPDTFGIYHPIHVGSSFSSKSEAQMAALLVTQTE
jgi:hypothetical protein